VRRGWQYPFTATRPRKTSGGSDGGPSCRSSATSTSYPPNPPPADSTRPGYASTGKPASPAQHHRSSKHRFTAQNRSRGRYVANPRGRAGVTVWPASVRWGASGKAVEIAARRLQVLTPRGSGLSRKAILRRPSKIRSGLGSLWLRLPAGLYAPCGDARRPLRRVPQPRICSQVALPGTLRPRWSRPPVHGCTGGPSCANSLRNCRRMEYSLAGVTSPLDK